MMEAKGIAKLGEEIGELQIELGKLQQLVMKMVAFGVDDHPDGQSNLLERFEAEAGDVKAALDFVINKLGANVASIEDRATAKLLLFQKWDGMKFNNPNDMTIGDKNGKD